MQREDRTFIIIEPDVGIQASDFLAEWNARAAIEDRPLAVINERMATFDGDLLKAIGDAANFIGIATFIGLPTISSIVSKLWLSKRSRARQSASPPRSEPAPLAAATPAPLAFEETIIDLAPNGRVKKIVVRRRA